jgi:hypothetical protein
VLGVFAAILIALLTLLTAGICLLLAVFVAGIVRWAHDEGLLTRKSVAILEDAVRKRGRADWEGQIGDDAGPPDPTIGLIPDLPAPIPPSSFVPYPDMDPADWLLHQDGVDMAGQVDQFPATQSTDPIDLALQADEPILLDDGRVMKDGVIVYTPPDDPTPDAPLFP